MKGALHNAAIRSAGFQLLGALKRLAHRPRPLRTRLLVLTLASALPVTLFAGMLLVRLHERERVQLEERLQQTALDLAGDVDRQLGAMVATLKALATSPLLEQARLAEFHAQARAASTSPQLAILLVRADGQQVLNTRVDFGSPLPVMSDLDTLATTIATRRNQVSNLFIGKVSGRPQLNIHVPVVRGEAVPYVLLMAFDPMLLQEITRQQFGQADWVRGITDGNRRVIARSEQHERYVNSLMPREVELDNPKPGVTLSTSVSGATVLRALTPIRNANWVAGATVELSTINAAARNSIIALAIAGSLVMGFAAAGAIFLSRSLAREFKDLTDSAEQLEKGGVIALTPSRVSEINEVKRTMIAASERRQAHESERDLLVRELSHRVKNSFAVLQSILNATLRSTVDPKTFAENFRGRLHSMAAAQDILTASEWQNAELEPLARSQLAAYMHGTNSRIKISGERVLLPAALAVPVGLILHELGTNAAKYGSLSSSEGQVQLSWQLHDDGEGSDRLQLDWREIDGPPVNEPERRGFGSTLIERSLPHARVERRFEPGGLHCSISFLLKRPVDDFALDEQRTA